ncbi:MAG: PorV/PorQ family protein [Bacteroidetes bacterium]|nr:PorV/PorQ family protein [Bacteroidota bacterium]
MALGIMAMSFGDIQITTNDLPEGGIGNFKPQFLNIGLSYAKSFSNSIYGGITIRIISESSSDVKAQGVAFDAGIQYVTGFNEAKDNLKFGISLKNVGTPMKYSGDGLSFRGNPPVGNSYQQTIESRTEKFELPSLVNIGASYDFKPADLHRITAVASFTSNSFTYDQFGLGLEYSFKEMFSLRGGYLMEKDMNNNDNRLTALTGLNGGISIDLPLGKGGKKVGIDYSYRSTEFFDGSHGLGVRLML